MKVIRQFALIMALVLPLLVPNMLCALPNAHLTPAEHACCKQMKGHCESMGMPASSSCCQKMSTASQWNVAQLPPVLIQTTPNAVAVLRPVVLIGVPAGRPDDALQRPSALPQSPPSAISILRI